MSEDEIKRLRALAEVATPGPWRLEGDGDLILMGGNGELLMDGVSYYPTALSRPEDWHYVAAVSPDVVLALLDEIERLRSGK